MAHPLHKVRTHHNLLTINLDLVAHPKRRRLLLSLSKKKAEVHTSRPLTFSAVTLLSTASGETDSVNSRNHSIHLSSDSVHIHRSNGSLVSNLGSFLRQPSRLQHVF